MDAEDANPLESRPPRSDDLPPLCQHLNEHGAQYIVVGGFAIIQQGLVRATEDVDLLIEASRENQRRVRKALEYLPDKAVREVTDDDLDQYVVVRVADEFVIDLMLKACGVDFHAAKKEIEWHEIGGVKIPFASAQLLWRLKQTYRDKDALDRQFLAEKLRKPKS